MHLYSRLQSPGRCYLKRLASTRLLILLLLHAVVQLHTSDDLYSAELRLSDYSIEFDVYPDTVIPHQSTYVRVEIMNTTDTEVPLPDPIPLGGVFDLRFVDSTGDLIRGPLIPHSSFGPSIVGTLPAFGSFISYVSITQMLWDPYIESSTHRFTGSELAVRVDLNPVYFQDIAEDSSVSWIARFHVRMPTTEESKAQNAYVNAHVLSREGDIDGCLNVLWQIVDQKPESPLVSETLRYLFFLARNQHLQRTATLEDELAYIATRHAAIEPQSPMLSSYYSLLRITGLNTIADDLLSKIQRTDRASPAKEAIDGANRLWEAKANRDANWKTENDD